MDLQGGRNGALDEKVDRSTAVEPVGGGDPEYAEFLEMRERFTGVSLLRLTRKVDWHVMPQLILVYCLTYIDRSNVGNARLFGAQQDNHLSDADWNTGLTLLFVTFAFMAPPSNLLVKRVGPSIVLPIMTICVGAIIMGSACSHSRAQWFSLRLLLGIFEAGIYPGCTYTLTTWYTPAQLHSRTNIFYLGAVLSGAFGGLLAFAIGQADHIWGYRGWRWIYMIEGLITLLSGTAIFFVFQRHPSKPARWLTLEEQRFLVLRNRYQYGHSRTGSKDDFSLAGFVSAAKSWHTWIVAFAFFSAAMAIYGLSLSLPTIIANMGFSAARAQALSAPPYVFAALCVATAGFVSDRYRTRTLACVIPASVGFIGLLIAVLSVSQRRLVALSYIGVCLGAGGLYCLTPGLTAWMGLNSAGQTKRAGAIAIIVFFGNCGGIPGSNIYLARQAPKYPVGFGVSLALTGAGCIVTPIIYALILARINRKRAALTEDDVLAKYSRDELQEMGDRSPLYRYEY